MNSSGKYSEIFKVNLDKSELLKIKEGEVDLTNVYHGLPHG